MKDNIQIGDWHHSPLHLFIPNTLYMVTGSTFHKQHIFDSPQKLQLLQNILFEVMQAYNWELQAWVLFANHYHFIARSPDDGTSLKRLIQHLHSDSARLVNKIDSNPGRRIWFQYWDTCLTYENSYYARLNYIQNNPVKHGLVPIADEYPFCSAKWFKENADPGLINKLASSPYDRVNVPDDYL